MSVPSGFAQPPLPLRVCRPRRCLFSSPVPAAHDPPLLLPQTGPRRSRGGQNEACLVALPRRMATLGGLSTEKWGPLWYKSLIVANKIKRNPNEKTSYSVHLIFRIINGEKLEN